MPDIAPSSNVTKIGSLLLIFAVALLAVWVVNNVAFVGKLTARRTAA
jgi:hypothetical protein